MLNIQTTRAEARTFAIAAIGGAASIWDVAFNLGAYGTVFYDRILFVWLTSLTVLLVSFVLPDEHAPVPWGGRIVLALPTMWMTLALLNEPAGDMAIDDTMLLLGMGTYALSLPYALYVVTRITNPEFFEFKSRHLGVALAIIIFVIGASSFYVGRNNYLFLTCSDFDVSGDNEPDNCVQALGSSDLFE